MDRCRSTRRYYRTDQIWTDAEIPVGTTGQIRYRTDAEVPVGTTEQIRYRTELIRYRSTRRYYRTYSDSGVPEGTTELHRIQEYP